LLPNNIRNVDESSYIPELRCHQSIHRPCHWIPPEIPSPPDWDALHASIIKKKKLSCNHTMFQ
jgi:hypothetical protein